MLGNKRARCCYQKSHIWLASHRFPTPGLHHAFKIVIPNENSHKFSGKQLKTKEYESNCDKASYN